MSRQFASFPISDYSQTKIQVLNWVNRFNIFCFLDNHEYQQTTASFKCLVGAGSYKELHAPAGKGLQSLDAFLLQKQDWVFGHLGYDLKNEIEDLHSDNEDYIQFPDLFFYVPEVVVWLTESEISIGTVINEPGFYYNQINCSSPAITLNRANASIKSRFTREEYISVIEKLRQHILQGDLYEINFCQEFYDSNVFIDPLSVFWELGNTSPNPFAAFYRLHDKFLLCESPERYLKKTGNEIFSQPIKGTWPRDLSDKERDKENKMHLQQNTKERSENVMVVDLVRNDLSKVCREGSVRVEELFGVYSFPLVHQLISTVKGTIRNEISPVEIIRATFPMGSMTGAPKVRVMRLIEEYEKTKRGIFSGAVGYFSPDNDFDFNVVIRSILYNAATKYLSFQAGSGITYYSSAENEYSECLLKAQAIKKVLTGY